MGWLDDIVYNLAAILFILFFALIICFIPWAIYQSIVEKKEAEEFIAAHDCKMTEKTSAGKIKYLCNDGITYWK